MFSDLAPALILEINVLNFPFRIINPRFFSLLEIEIYLAAHL